MKKEQMKIGLRVKSNLIFSGVPEGTEGVIDEIYDIDHFMVAWDLPRQPLPEGYTRYDGKSSFVTGILRDGFLFDYLTYFDVVNK